VVYVTEHVGWSVCLSVCLSARYCGKTAEWIQILFGKMSEIGRGMGVLDGVDIVKGEGADIVFWTSHCTVTNGTLQRSSSEITLGNTFYNYHC